MKYYIVNLSNLAFTLAEELRQHISGYISTDSAGNLAVISEQGADKFVYDEEAAFYIAGDNPELRQLLVRKLLHYYPATKKHFPNFISDSVTLSTRNTIGIGNIILQNTVIEPNVTIGSFNLIKYGSILSSNTVIQDYNNIYSAVVSSNANVGSNNKIFDRSVITRSVTIGDNNIIAPGEVLYDDLDNNERYFSGIVEKVYDNDYLF